VVLKRLIREPLFHFLLIGAALFVLFAALNREGQGSDLDIVVTTGQVESLSANFTKVWRRDPTPEELKGLVDAHVQEEMLSREAVKLGLDQHDPVIRRRLQQKMEFLMEDFTALSPPTEAELKAYLSENPEKFQRDARFTFRHVYLDPAKRGDALEADASRLLADLRVAGPDGALADQGDRMLLPTKFVREPSAALSAQFGQGFVVALEGVPVGEWAGPIPSGYGQHLVFVSERTEARVPELDEVRRRVERDVATARREEASARFLEELLKRYTVTIEWPEPEVLSGDRPARAAQP
jgi:hypothetical protein